MENCSRSCWYHVGVLVSGPIQDNKPSLPLPHSGERHLQQEEAQQHVDSCAECWLKNRMFCPKPILDHSLNSSMVLKF